MRPALASCFCYCGWLAAAAPVFAQVLPDPGKPPQACGPHVNIEYTDDDPDYFIIDNLSAEGWELTTLAIDLSRSAGNLVFDTEEGGPGVGGASPFYAGSTSPVKLIGADPGQDGGRRLALSFGRFTPGRHYSFHVDVDSLKDGEGRTWVVPQDIANAQVQATFTGPSGQSETVDAFFDALAEADSGVGGCV